MKKIIWFLALVGVLQLSPVVASAQDGFYVIGGGSPTVGTKITSLPYIIASPGFYFLGQNLAYSGDTNAITVNADNVTLDLMGCSLTNSGAGSLSNGIYLEGRNNVEIRNGTVSGFNTGINESSASGGNHRVISVSANNNTIGDAIGIYLLGKGHLVRGCTASNNSYAGIYLASGTITGCVANNNPAYNMYIQGSGSLLDNVATNSTGGYGFELGTENLLLDGNSAHGNHTNYDSGGAATVWGVNAGH
jgi:hypothetical protein